MTVVVPTRDRPDLLDGCLRSIRAVLRPEDELIVVDSASTVDCVQPVADAHGARYVRCDYAGASRARNAGWRASIHEVVAFVDDDVRVEADWTATIASAFGAEPTLAFLTGRIGKPPGEEPEFPVALFVGPDAFEIDASTEGDVGHSANMAVLKGALEIVSGFDEALGAGAEFRAAEDKDLIERLIGAGMRGRYEPNMSAVHLAWRTRRDVLKLNWAYGLGLGAWIAKLLRTDRMRAVRAIRITLWTWGALDILKWMRRRLKFHTLVAAVRVTGVILGLLVASPRTVREGHFVHKSRHMSRA